jgi:hypothetical protein
MVPTITSCSVSIAERACDKERSMQTWRSWDALH